MNGKQLGLWDDVAKQSASNTIFYIGETVNLLNRELAKMLAIAESIPIRPHKKGRSKEAKQENQKRLKLIASLKRYHPGTLFCADNWAIEYDNLKMPITEYQVKDGILWELEYWQLATPEQAGLLRRWPMN